MKVINTEFIKTVAKTSGHTQKDVKEIMAGIQDALILELGKATEETPVDVAVLPTLIVGSAYVEPHEARNPKTGETVTAVGKYRVKARVTGIIKDAVNE